MWAVIPRGARGDNATRRCLLSDYAHRSRPPVRPPCTACILRTQILPVFLLFASVLSRPGARCRCLFVYYEYLYVVSGINYPEPKRISPQSLGCFNDDAKNRALKFNEADVCDEAPFMSPEVSKSYEHIPFFARSQRTTHV